MSESTRNVDGTEDSTMAPDSVLGLPVETFAFILVGVGVGGAIIFVVIYCLAKAYCKGCCCADPYIDSPKGRSNFKSVREVWEQDTLKRKRDLEAAGYANDAFDNLEELSALSFHKSEKGSDQSVGYTAPHSHSNGIDRSSKNKPQQSMSSDHLYKKKKKQNGAAVRQSKSSSPNMPVLQVNGERLSPDFDQSPRSKLGSSLVRIEEEVIVEEELDVEKSKSKKKSKGSKKSLLTTEQSSDGYRAEETADPTVVDAKAVPPTGSLLNSVVVVHADNDMFKDGETGEQVLIAVEYPADVDTPHVSLDVSETPSVERVPNAPDYQMNEIAQSVSVDSTHSSVYGVSNNNRSELKADFAHDNVAYECDEEESEQIDNDISDQINVVHVSKDCQTDLKNLTNEITQPYQSDSGPTSIINETTNEVNVGLSETNLVSRPSDFSVSPDINIDTVAEIETGEEVIVGGIHPTTMETQGNVEGQSLENISETEVLSQDLNTIHSDNVWHPSVVIDLEEPVVDRERAVDKQGDHISNSKSHTSPNNHPKMSHQLETEANFINNNSVHYFAGKQSSLVFKSPNSLANGGLILTGSTSQTLVSGNGFLKNSENSEEDKLRSWLHDVYVSRSEDPTHL